MNLGDKEDKERFSKPETALRSNRRHAANERHFNSGLKNSTLLSTEEAQVQGQSSGVCGLWSFVPFVRW